MIKGETGTWEKKSYQKTIGVVSQYLGSITRVSMGAISSDDFQYNIPEMERVPIMQGKI